MRVKDWIEQAERTIASAEHSLEGGFYEDACFLAHHAGVLLGSALLVRKATPETGPSVYYMLLKAEAPQDVLHSARVLDTFYLPSRYPYCFEKGSPKDYFDEQTAKEAVGHAKAIMEYIKRQLD
ncbi:MAG: HEPN domain-containing protein [Nitrospirae bacterium]|nr:MAG: HEPN domain-containing protein [Nitrospirota bacterium]